VTAGPAIRYRSAQHHRLNLRLRHVLFLSCRAATAAAAPLAARGALLRRSFVAVLGSVGQLCAVRRLLGAGLGVAATIARTGVTRSTIGVSVRLDWHVVQLVAAAVALRAFGAERFQQPGADPLTCHLNQTQACDLGHLVPSPVAS